MKLPIKFLTVLIFLLVSTSISVNSQDVPTTEDSSDLPAHSIRVIAKVISSDYDYMVITVEQVVAYGSGTNTTPQSGEEIPVRLPGREKPDEGSRIEVDLKEKIDVGAMPTSYIMLNYKTIE
jgi:hypothetical protein